MAYLNNAKQAAAEPAPEAAPPEEPPAEEPAPPEEEGTEAPQGSEPEAPDEGDDSDWPDYLSEEEQSEFEQAISLVHQVLFTNDQTSRAVLGQLSDDQEPAVRAEAAARAVVLVLTQVDKKLDLSEKVIPEVMLTIADGVIELGKRVKKIPFEDNDIMAILQASAEGARAAFGGGQQQQPAEQGAAPEDAPPEEAAPPAEAAALAPVAA